MAAAPQRRVITAPTREGLENAGREAGAPLCPPRGPKARHDLAEEPSPRRAALSQAAAGVARLRGRSSISPRPSLPASAAGLGNVAAGSPTPAPVTSPSQPRAPRCRCGDSPRLRGRRPSLLPAASGAVGRSLASGQVATPPLTPPRRFPAGPHRRYCAHSRLILRRSPPRPAAGLTARAGPPPPRRRRCCCCCCRLRPPPPSSRAGPAAAGEGRQEGRGGGVPALRSGRAETARAPPHPDPETSAAPAGPSRRLVRSPAAPPRCPDPPAAPAALPGPAPPPTALPAAPQAKPSPAPSPRRPAAAPADWLARCHSNRRGQRGVVTATAAPSRRRGRARPGPAQRHRDLSESPPRSSVGEAGGSRGAVREPPVPPREGGSGSVALP